MKWNPVLRIASFNDIASLNSFMVLRYAIAISLDLPSITAIAVTARVDAMFFVFAEFFAH